MTTILSEHKQSRSEPWDNYLYPELRNPQTAWEHIETASEDALPGEVALAIKQVIEANSDLLYIAYKVICPFSKHLSLGDIENLKTTLKKVFSPEQQSQLTDLYWWLDTLQEKLKKGVTLFEITVDPILPEDIRSSENYQQWKFLVA